eukprot:Nitzschia sp. Nitz4//scaffold22_size323478//132816//135872//NITZ4_000528-RA/size323478-processed-gene-0.22-mRNA-1//1//CDS//3329542998//2478//frame0
MTEAGEATSNTGTEKPTSEELNDTNTSQETDFTVGGSVSKPCLCLLDGFDLSTDDYQRISIPISTLPATLGRSSENEKDASHFVGLGKRKALSRKQCRISFRHANGGHVEHDPSSDSLVYRKKSQCDNTAELPKTTGKLPPRGFFVIECLGKNRILVNQERVEHGESVILTPGAAIRLSGICVYFLVPPASSAPPKSFTIPSPATTTASASRTTGTKRKASTDETTSTSNKKTALSEMADMSSEALLEEMDKAHKAGVWERKHHIMGALICSHAIEDAAKDPKVQAIAADGGIARTDVMAWIQESPKYKAWVEQMLSNMEPKSYQASITKSMLKVGFTRTAGTGRYIKWLLPAKIQLDKSVTSGASTTKKKKTTTTTTSSTAAAASTTAKPKKSEATKTKPVVETKLDEGEDSSKADEPEKDEDGDEEQNNQTMSTTDIDMHQQRSKLATAAAFVDATNTRYGFSSKNLLQLGGSELSRIPETIASDHEWAPKDTECGGIITQPVSQGNRIVVQLYWDVAPLACENFATLCANGSAIWTGGKVKPAPMGESGKPLTFRKSTIHRIVPGFVVQGGDFVFGNGSGGESVFGKKFKDERAGLQLSHNRRGILSMGNSGKNSNSSQFFITLDKAPQCDGKHVIFGHVASGWQVLDAMEEVGSKSGDPSVSVEITDCGIYQPLETPGSGYWYDTPDPDSFTGVSPVFMIRPRVVLVTPTQAVAQKFCQAMGDHVSVTQSILMGDNDAAPEDVAKQVVSVLSSFGADVAVIAPACKAVHAGIASLPFSWTERNACDMTVQEVVVMAKPMDVLSKLRSESWPATKRSQWQLDLQ